jgi:hypothetical protein
MKRKYQVQAIADADANDGCVTGILNLDTPDLLVGIFLYCGVVLFIEGYLAAPLAFRCH